MQMLPALNQNLPTLAFIGAVGTSACACFEHGAHHGCSNIMFCIPTRESEYPVKADMGCSNARASSSIWQLCSLVCLNFVVQFRFCYDDEFQAMDCQQGKEVEDCRRDQIILPVWQQTSTAAA